MLGAATAIGCRWPCRSCATAPSACTTAITTARAPAGRAFALAGLLILLAAVRAASLLWRAGGFKPSRWAPPRLEAITIAVIALWVATAAINLYSIDDTDYGSAVFAMVRLRPSWGAS